MSFGLAAAADRVAVAAAGLPFPEGDPDGLRDSARRIGEAASAVSTTGHMTGWAAAAATDWVGDAAASFRGAVGQVQAEMAAGSGSLERAGGAVARLATGIEDAQEEVGRLAAKVLAAEEAAEEAEARAILASIALAGASAAVDLLGSDPPRGLVDARSDADDAAGRAQSGAAGAREHAADVRRQAQRRAKELCEDCERQDRTVASIVADAAASAPTGIGIGSMPGARYATSVARRMSVSDFKELAFMRAGIDPTAWNPRAGLGANDATVRAVYAYYRQLGLEHGEFQWMKMAAVGGPLFYAGFKDIDTAGDWADGSSVVRPIPGVFGDISAEELRWNEGQFLTMQKAIFSDLAWQHEAFALGGAGAIHGAVNKLPVSERQRVLDDRTSQAWDDIDSGDPDRVTAGNYRLIEREQGPVIQPYYDEMRDRPTGGPFTFGLTRQADTPIPGSETYLEHSHHPILQGIPEGNISNYDDRIGWIQDSLWPAHQEQLQTPGAVEENLGRDFDSEADGYRQVTPGEIARDLAPPLIPPIQLPRISIPGIG